MSTSRRTGHAVAAMSGPGPSQRQEAVVALLDRLNAGDNDALDALFGILYEELRDVAQRQRWRWRGDHTLNTTALVHEAYVKLVGQARIDVESRAHFSALAATAMRHILCDHARKHATRRRGGGLTRLSLHEMNAASEQAEFTGEQADVLVVLDEALRKLERVDARQSRIVECRFFGGLTIEETATAIGISPRTVKRDWALAQAWLHREMTSSP
jgi:RNA polymerase sigma factor (TIGR02999 family)